MLHLIGLVLMAPTPVDAGIFGVQLGVDGETAIERFAPLGQTTGGTWSRTQAGDAIAWRCEAKNRCFGVPSRAVFHLHRKKVVSVSLTVEASAAPPDLPASKALFEVEARANLGQPAAASQGGGRLVRYFLREGHTIVWAQDGADAEIKVSLDAADPVGRAEAVAAGAKADLKALPGAADYAAGHKAIGERDWATAEAALGRVVAQKKAARPLKDQAKLVLGMTIAARLQAAGPPTDAKAKAAARKALARAAKLAPLLGDNLKVLGDRLGL